MSSYNKICGCYDRNRDNFTLLHAWNYREPSAKVASAEPARVFSHTRVVDVLGYSSVFSAPVGSTPKVRVCNHDHVQNKVRG